MICDRLRDDVFLFAADELEGEARAKLARHLDSGCPTCIGALAAARAALGRLTLSLEPVEPPPALRQQILSGVVTAQASESTTEPPARRRLWVGWLGAAAALVLGFGLASHLAGGQVASLEQALEAAHADVERLEQRSSISLAAFNISQSKDVKTIALKGAAVTARGGVTLYWEWRTGECLLRATGLDKLAGQKLALWFSDEEGAPLAGGDFEVSEDGRAMHLTSLPYGIDVYGNVYVTVVTDFENATPAAAHELAGALEG